MTIKTYLALVIIVVVIVFGVIFVMIVYNLINITLRHSKIQFC